MLLGGRVLGALETNRETVVRTIAEAMRTRAVCRISQGFGLPKKLVQNFKNR